MQILLIAPLLGGHKGTGGHTNVTKEGSNTIKKLENIKNNNVGLLDSLETDKKGFENIIKHPTKPSFKVIFKWSVCIFNKALSMVANFNIAFRLQSGLKDQKNAYFCLVGAQMWLI